MADPKVLAGHLASALVEIFFSEMTTKSAQGSEGFNQTVRFRD